MSLLCCYAGAPVVTLSLRHHYVSADELSLTIREEGVRTGRGGGVRDTDSKHTEREREGERRDGCCLL